SLASIQEAMGRVRLITAIYSPEQDEGPSRRHIRGVVTHGGRRWPLTTAVSSGLRAKEVNKGRLETSNSANGHQLLWSDRPPRESSVECILRDAGGDGDPRSSMYDGRSSLTTEAPR